MRNYLSAEHLAMLRASGISDEAIEARGYRTVTSRQELVKLGFKDYQARVPGLLVPIHSAHGDIVSYQYRPDDPRTRNGKPVKYDSLLGKSSRLDVPPGAMARLADPNVPLWITEGSKKADAAVTAGLCCVALVGVWNFRGKNEHGGSVVIGDFEMVPLKGREVVIAFDSDSIEKPSVRLAEQRLAGFLRSRGAHVKIARIPGQRTSKVGRDDCLASGGRA